MFKRIPADLTAAAPIFAAQRGDPREHAGARSTTRAPELYFREDACMLYGEVLTFSLALQAHNFFSSPDSAVPA
jgi:hypothetical protein